MYKRQDIHKNKKATIDIHPVDFAKKSGIKVIAAPEGNRTAVGEHVVGMILCLMNKILLSHNNIQNGIWDREVSRGHEIKNKVVDTSGAGDGYNATYLSSFIQTNDPKKALKAASKIGAKIIMKKGAIVDVK